MPQESWDRRKFNELAAAALGGLMAGSLAGCGNQADPKRSGNAPGKVVGERHLCRGLNDCKGQGVSGKNDCRGQGECATVEHHTCGGQNDCKGLGGCGPSAGANDCKGQGGCRVPLMESAWEQVRERKVDAWTKAGEKFSDPPPKKDEEAPQE